MALKNQQMWTLGKNCQNFFAEHHIYSAEVRGERQLPFFVLEHNGVEHPAFDGFGFALFMEEIRDK